MFNGFGLGLELGPRLERPVTELFFSNFRPALNFAMKLSAFVLTSGLGQKNVDPTDSVIGDSPPPSDGVVGCSLSSPKSRSGD
jgi:hypothetical protein